MRPVTDRFLEVLRGSHRMAARARLVEPGQYGVKPTGEEIPIVSGSVTLDITAKIRTTLDMTTAHAWPEDASSGLTPYGNEVFVERGIVYGDETTEWVSQGYFRLYSVKQQDAPAGSIRITAKDRMSGLIDARPIAPIQYGRSASVSAVFEDLIGQVYPNAPILYDFDATSHTFSSDHVLGDDRYGFLRDIADSLGKVFYVDYAGRFVVASPPNPGEPVFTVNHGAGGVLTQLSRSLDRSAVYNGVVASGQQPGDEPPVRGVALDADPDSPTYWYGPFGKVPKFYTSTFLTTDQQCDDAAASMLERVRGLPYSIDLSMVPNPALEPLDVVSVAYRDRVAAETHVLEQLRIPLDSGGAMTGRTRKKNLGGSGDA